MSTPLLQLRKTWKNYLAEDKWSPLFTEMQAQLQGDAANILIHQRGRHQATYEKEMKGTIAAPEAGLVYSQVRDALIYLIDQLTENDIGSGPATEDPLDLLVRELPIEIPLTPLYLVNCDRRRSLRFFRKCFGRWQDAPCHFQFYYLLACPTQEPEGFAERLVYELAGAYTDTHHHSINYRRSDGDERVRIEPLPIGLTLNDSKEGFKKYFAERFNLGNTSFEDYLRTGLPHLQWKYVATALSITAGDWDPDILEDYMQWLMDAFLEAEGQTPTFLFFMVVWLKNAHFPEKIRRYDHEALDSVKDLVQQNKEYATLISPLPPVPADDLEEWLEKLGGVSQVQKNNIIRTIADRLQGEELTRFQSPDKLLDMERIENLQERVWHIHQ